MTSNLSKPIPYCYKGKWFERYSQKPHFSHTWYLPKPSFKPLCTSFIDTGSIHIQYTPPHTPLLIHFIEISEVLVDGIQQISTTTGGRRNTGRQINGYQKSRRFSAVAAAQCNEKMFLLLPPGWRARISYRVRVRVRFGVRVNVRVRLRVRARAHFFLFCHKLPCCHCDLGTYNHDPPQLQP